MRCTNTRTGFNWRIVIGQLGREEFITMGIWVSHFVFFHWMGWVSRFVCKLGRQLKSLLTTCLYFILNIELQDSPVVSIVEMVICFRCTCSI